LRADKRIICLALVRLYEAKFSLFAGKKLELNASRALKLFLHLTGANCIYANDWALLIDVFFYDIAQQAEDIVR